MTLVFALLLAVSVMLLKSPQPTDESAQRDAMITATKQVALELSTIGASNAAQHIDSLTNQSTGEFRSQLGTYARIFQSVLQAGNVNSEAKVTAAAIERIGPDSANTLVTVSATVTNSQVPVGQLRNYRLAMQLQRDGDRWLVSKVEYVQ
jgi:Mce-associated membrane protein